LTTTNGKRPAKNVNAVSVHGFNDLYEEKIALTFMKKYIKSLALAINIPTIATKDTIATHWLSHSRTLHIAFTGLHILQFVELEIIYILHNDLTSSYLSESMDNMITAVNPARRSRASRRGDLVSTLVLIVRETNPRDK
jgi:hypothetical protein